jgi:hypothetical protein
MSGGSWDYFYMKLEEVADRMRKQRTVKRKAFGVLLQKCAKAIHDIEYVDSYDYGEGDEIAAIDDVLGFNTAQEIKSIILNDLQKLKEDIIVLEESLTKKL